MKYVEFFTHQLITRLEHWNITHSVYGFAAVLIAYVFVVFRRPG
jgi:hypothetical protein